LYLYLMCMESCHYFLKKQNLIKETIYIRY
jgi:hypothetical protein